MTHDLSHYLGPEFKGEHLDQYLLKEPSPRLALYHSVGASDAIDKRYVRTRMDDGLPETLSGWIRYNGLTHIKIKLAGDDLDWDLDRVVRIDHTTSEVQAERRVRAWAYSLDFNERCPNVGYLLEFLRRLKEKTPLGYLMLRFAVTAHKCLSLLRGTVALGRKYSQRPLRIFRMCPDGSTHICRHSKARIANRGRLPNLRQTCCG